MSDPQNFGLDELGQRLQAMGFPDKAPVVEPRLRPYQGAPLPAGQVPNGQAAVPPISAARAIPAYEPFEDFHHVAKPANTTPPATQSGQTQSSFSAGSGTTSVPESPFANPLNNGSAWVNHLNSEHIPEDATAAPAAPKALPSPAEDPNAPKSGFQRAIDAVRSTLPLVQRLLPLLDGNFATVLATLVGTQPHHPPPAQVHVDLEPVERGIADLRASHRDLRGQVQEQVVSLKRVEDQLERVREATDRNTLEQQELVEDLRSVGNRISTFAVVGLVLLAISLGLNIYFLIQLQHILR